MKHFFLFSVLQLAFSLSAQISFDKLKYDFGDLEVYSPRFVDFQLSNKGLRKEWLLSVKKPADVVYLPTKQELLPDSSITIRLQVNPTKKGRFSYDVAVFLSDRAEAVTLRLTGNMAELPLESAQNFTACPDFTTQAAGRDPNSFELTVITIDKETKEPLPGTAVSLIQNGRSVWNKATDKQARIKEKSTLGYSYFYAHRESYKETELGAYINFKRNYIVLELERIPSTEPIPEPPLISEVSEVPDLSEILQENPPTRIVEPAPPGFDDLSTDDFSETHFKPVNVVFVLDVSSSMKQADKIELMKYAMLKLSELLREQDRFGIVTYADQASILLKPSAGSEKEKIQEEIRALKAFGYTAGGSGIKLGFQVAKSSFITDGVNQVIVITDGAFNRNSTDYKKYVTKYAKKGIHMSVVGIKIKDVDEVEMREAAALGKGHFVPIDRLADAENNLRQAIRLMAFKK